jgi:hypothetical protein
VKHGANETNLRQGTSPKTPDGIGRALPTALDSCQSELINACVSIP